MNLHIKTIIVLFAAVTLMGCTSTKRIQQNMSSSSYSLEYLMDSEVAIKDSAQNISVSIDTVYFDSYSLNRNVVVVRQKGYFIPLVFVYVWFSQNNCIIGKSIIQEDVPTFLESALVSEINRSGSYIADTTGTSDYQIELSIDNISTEGPYVSKGFYFWFLYFYGGNYQDIAGPAVSKLAISYKLKKGGEVVHSNSFNSEKVTDPISKVVSTQKVLQKQYAASMVEANSNNLKSVIELITEDIEKYLASSK